MILFPVPIRTAAILLCVIYTLTVITNAYNAGGDLCHLGGMATGFIWVMGRPYFTLLRGKYGTVNYEKKIEEQRKAQFEVDRILQKVHENGIHSLTRKEKSILQKATEEQKRGGKF
jgi:hypothetical protein